jgi:hypothetical protein
MGRKEKYDLYGENWNKIPEGGAEGQYITALAAKVITIHMKATHQNLFEITAEIFPAYLNNSSTGGATLVKVQGRSHQGPGTCRPK